VSSGAPAANDDASQAADRVLALDNVPLDLPIAGAGTRSLAAFIDYFVLGLIMAVCAITAIVVGGYLNLKSFWWAAALVFALFLLEYGFFAGCEIAMAGQTLGKRLVGLRVVSAHGSRPSRAALLIRNAVRLVDLLIGVPLMAFDRNARRIGDRLAGTLVIRTRRAASAIVRRVPRGWTPPQIAVLESFLQRRDELQPEKAEQIARSLLAAITRDDPEFLPADDTFSDPVERLVSGVSRGDAARP